MSEFIGVVSAETFVAVLTTLSELLDKAEKQCRDQGIDPLELLNARLAPDMYPLHVQVRFACHQARDAMARLIGQEPPPRPRLDETPTFAGLRTLIRETSESVAALRPEPLVGAESRKWRCHCKPPSCSRPTVCTSSAAGRSPTSTFMSSRLTTSCATKASRSESATT